MLRITITHFGLASDRVTAKKLYSITVTHSHTLRHDNNITSLQANLQVRSYGRAKLPARLSTNTLRHAGICVCALAMTPCCRQRARCAALWGPTRCGRNKYLYDSELLWCHAPAGGFEQDSVFKGYVSRDRRKAYVVEADRAADQLLSRAAAARKLPLHAMLGCLTPLCCSRPVSGGVLCSTCQGSHAPKSKLSLKGP
jgi:hypothetical protein